MWRLVLSLWLVCVGLAQARTLERGNGPEPDTLDAHRTQVISGFNVLRDLYEGLVSESADGELVAGLASSWRISPDGLTWTFDLRPGLRWSDGSPFAAGDVVASFRRALDPATAAPYANLFADVVGAEAVIAGRASPSTLGIEAPDETHVVFRLARPLPLAKLLTLPIAYPVRVDRVNTFGAQHTRPGHLLGTGAYRLVDWQPQAAITLERNPYFHAADTVRIERVRYHVTEDAANELKRYLAGDLDLTETVPPGRMDKLDQRFGPALRVAPYLGVFYFGLNLRRAPFREAPALREALVLALDRDVLTRYVTGLGEAPAYSLVPPGVSHYVGAEPAYARWTQDERVARARELYRQAGYSDEHPLEVELRYNTSTQHRRLALATAAMWKQTLGVRTRLRNEEWKVFVINRRQGAITQVFRGGWIGDYDDAASFLQTFAGDQVLNTTGYRNANFDAAIAHALAAPGLDERNRELARAERLLLADHAIVPIYFYTSKHLVRPELAGYESNALDRHATRWLWWREGASSP